MNLRGLTYTNFIVLYFHHSHSNLFHYELGFENQVLHFSLITFLNYITLDLFLLLFIDHIGTFLLLQLLGEF